MIFCGAIIDFINSKEVNFYDQIHNEYLEFTKIIYVEANLENFCDIDKYNHLRDYSRPALITYISEHQERFNQN